MPASLDQDFKNAWVACARNCQTRWAAMPIRERLRRVRNFRHLLAGRAESLAFAAAEVNQRPVAEKLVSEILPLADACRWLEQRAVRALATRYFGSRGRPLWLHGVTFEVQRKPFGIVLVIGPANYPLFLPAVHALQALVAGNAVLLKPAPGAFAVACAFAKLTRLAGLEPALVTILPESIEAARHAIAHGVDKVVFTGSSENGRDVLSELAKSNTPAVMELSGEDAVLVLADADVSLVIRALCFAARWNGGATCMAPRRIIVIDSLASDLHERMCRAELTGLFVEAVASEEAALHRLATFRFGLGVSIFSRDLARARWLASRIESGFVLINDLLVPTADPRMPFGGVRASGFGVTRGEEGLREMTFAHVVAVRHGRFHPHFDELRAEDGRLFSSYIRAAHCRGTKRLNAMRVLMRTLLARMKSKERCG